MTREQLQQIRDALEHWHEIETASGSVIDYTDELDILDAALAAPEQDPVAWQERQIIGWKDDTYKWSDWYSCKYNTEQVVKARARTTQYEWRPLYTAPVAAPQPVSMETVYDTIIEWSTAGKGSRRELARRMIALFAAPQREWQGLTKDEINDCAGAEIYSSTWAMTFARAIEAALKEKNHG